MVRDLFNELGLGVYTPSPEVQAKQQELSNLSQQIANTQSQLQAQREAQLAQPEPQVIQPQEAANPLAQFGNYVGVGANTLQGAFDNLNATNRAYYEQARGWNPITNALADLNEIGTGLTGMAVHPIDTLKSIGGYITDTDRYYKHPKHPIVGGIGEVLNDTANLLMSTYGVSTKDAKDLLDRVVAGDIKGAIAKYGENTVKTAIGAYQHPLFTTLDIATFGSLGTGVKAAEGITKGVAGKAGTAIDTSAAKVMSKTYEASDAFNAIKKEVSNPITGKYKSSDLPTAIKNLEEGAIATSESEKAATKALSKAVDAWDKSIPEPYKVDNFTVAHNQRMVRTGKATSLADADKYTQQYAKARPITEQPKVKPTVVNEEGKTVELKGKIGSKAQTGKIEYDWNLIKSLAEDGDEWAKELLVSKASFDKGYLKLVPHGLAEVVKDASGSMLSNEERIFAGKYSTRVFGTAEYDAIADQIKNANEWLDKQIQHFTEAEIAREIVEEGTLGGQKLVEDSAKAKDIVYVDREALAQGDLNTAFEKALDVQTPNSIPIDKALVQELVDQFKVRSGKPFGERWMNELYQTGKQNLLAQGTYLAGNAITGANNAIMNSGFNPAILAQDIVDAARTKGKLAKEMGIYRNLGQTTVKAKNPLIKGIQTVNKPIADALNYIDAKMQNTFVEMAAHNRLRQQGISFNQRANELTNMDKTRLAESIHDARMIGLLNPNRTLLPKAFHKGASILNPFWRWLDTATQSSMYMMAKHPIVNNLVLNEFGGRIGYDQEMQRRLGLGVSSDKPLVSYRYNPSSRKLEEVTCEFIPQLASIKLGVELGEAIKKGDIDELPFKIAPSAVPVYGAIINAVAGKDRYGRPIVRPEADRRMNGMIQTMQGDRRYRFVPNETIGFEELKGGQGDEILSTAVNELFAYPKLFNRVVLPTAAGVSNLLTGGNTRYYKPYQNQLLGELGKGGEMPEYANPRSSAAGLEMLDILGGKYSRTYDPIWEFKNQLPLDPQSQKRLMRGFGQRMGKDNMILEGGR